MNDLYIYTLFESGGRPKSTGILIGNNVHIYDFYRPGAQRPIGIINKQIEIIRELIKAAYRKGVRIVTSDFKSHLTAFDLPLEIHPYNVYDLHLPTLPSMDSQTKSEDVLRKILEKMKNARIYEYQKIFANAAVVYQDLENRGLTNNYERVYPAWSQKTFSGRSKTSGFNIQGFTDHHLVLPPGASDKDIIIHFDWICADIRVASLLSGDKKLQLSFDTSAPYTHMMNEINLSSLQKITREECKILLLKSINSMDFTSVALTHTYQELGDWILRCKKAMQEKGGYLETILKRRFRVAHAKNDLAVLNGAMQGSVAHGMQNVIRYVWERLGNRIITEIHDSLIVSAPADSAEIRSIINIIAPRMLYPFDGVLPANPHFPFKVSIGNKWRKWKLHAIYRKSGIEYVKTNQNKESTKSSAETTSSPIANTTETKEKAT